MIDPLLFDLLKGYWNYRQKITDSLKETASNIYGELKSVKAMVKEENLEKIGNYL